MAVRISPRRYHAYTRRDIDRIPELALVEPHLRLAMKAISAVLPFRVNNYVVEELIRWEDVPEDPIFQATFPQEAMLDPEDRARMIELVRADASPEALKEAAREIQGRLNPHPAGQSVYNVPFLNGRPLAGMQHKYRETVLFFPSQGQTCHAYCSYCFRWAQFIGIESLKFANRQAEVLVHYLKAHQEAQSVLFTGGDPLIMKTATLRSYIEPLLDPELEHMNSIRIGTKAAAFWPYRFLTDPDADDLLRLFEEVRQAGRHLAFMAHFSHPRELETPAAQAALRRIRQTGAVVRCQAPLIGHVNDDPDDWADMWRLEVRLGLVPYYMFIARDTGPKGYFSVPLARAREIYRTAYAHVSGLARTVRGPSMSTTPGKVVIDGVATIGDEDVFVLRFIQARDPRWVGVPFFARFDPDATWLDELRPAFGEKEFFFEAPLRHIEREVRTVWRKKARRPLKLFAQVEWE